MQLVTVMFNGQPLAFKLDHDSRKWTPTEVTATDLLHEGDFPLIAHADSKRYELYSDGTFAEVEL